MDCTACVGAADQNSLAEAILQASGETACRVDPDERGVCRLAYSSRVRIRACILAMARGGTRVLLVYQYSVLVAGGPAVAKPLFEFAVAVAAVSAECGHH